MLLPHAVANCGRCRDVSPHFVSLYSLSSKFSSESTAGKAGAGGSQVTLRRWALLRCAWESVPAFVSFPSSELQTQTPQGNHSRDPGTCTGPTFFRLNHVRVFPEGRWGRGVSPLWISHTDVYAGCVSEQLSTRGFLEDALDSSMLQVCLYLPLLQVYPLSLH